MYSVAHGRVQRANFIHNYLFGALNVIGAQGGHSRLQAFLYELFSILIERFCNLGLLGLQLSGHEGGPDFTDDRCIGLDLSHALADFVRLSKGNAVGDGQPVKQQKPLNFSNLTHGHSAVFVYRLERSVGPVGAEQADGANGDE